MAATGKGSQTVHLRGAPPNLSAVVQLGRATRGSVLTSLDLPKALGETQLSAVLSPLGDGGAARVRLKLPRTTPPGTYHGTLEIEEESKAIVVEVEPRVRMRIFPTQASLQARPGETNELRLSLANLGNVAFDVPRIARLGLFHKQGMDLAVGRAFLAELAEDERRIDRFAEELREGYGGVAKLRVRKGSGKLEPNDARDLDIVLEVPSQVVPSRTYWGLWSFYDTNYKIELDIIPEKKNAGVGGRKS